MSDDLLFLLELISGGEQHTFVHSGDISKIEDIVELDGSTWELL